MFVQNEVSLEINLEVLEYELNLAEVGEEPEVDILLGVDLPVLDRGELHAHERLVKVPGQIDFNVSNIKVNI